MQRIVSLLIVLIVFTVAPLFAATVPTMDKDELKSRLGSKNFVILDVRQERDWSTSEYKIKDALRVDRGDLSITRNYPKDTTIVLYCA